MKQYNGEKFELSNIKLPSIALEKRNNGRPWVNFGDDNLFPQELLYLSNKSTTHASCLQLNKLSIAGNGYISSTASTIFLESQDYETSNSSVLDKIASSMAVFDGFALEVIWNVLGDKIVEIHNLPLEDIRVCHPDRYGNSNTYYYSNNWSSSVGFETIPGFDPKTAKTCPKQLLYIGLKSIQSMVYPIPSYSSALNYIANEYELSKHYLTCAENSFLPAAMVTFIGNLTEEEKLDNEIGFKRTFVGSEKNSKVLISYCESVDQKPIIETISSNNVVDEFINNSLECKSKIVTGNGITSPSLIAISDNDALFANGEELATAWTIYYNTKIKAYHNLIQKSMNLVLKYAGFSDAEFKIIPFTPTGIIPIVEKKNDQNNII